MWAHTGLSISAGRCLCVFACWDTCFVILCEMWRVGRAGQTVETVEGTAVQLHHRERGQMTGLPARQSVFQIEGSEKEKVQNKKVGKHFGSFSLRTLFFLLCLSHFARDISTEATGGHCLAYLRALLFSNQQVQQDLDFFTMNDGIHWYQPCQDILSERGLNNTTNRLNFHIFRLP